MVRIIFNFLYLTFSGEDLGGAKLHCSVSGIVDYFASTEDESFDIMRDCVESLNLAPSTDFDATVDAPLYAADELDILGGLKSLNHSGWQNLF